MLKKVVFLQFKNIKELFMDNEIKYNPEKNSIKIWPYLDDISQAIIPYSSNHLSPNVEMVINIDFSAVKRISSSGAAIALMKLISIPKRNRNRLFKLVTPEDENIEKYFHSSGFFAIANDYFQFNKYIGNIFEQGKSTVINEKTENYVIINEQQNLKITSFPIFRLKYNPKDERESVNLFSDWLDDNILSILDNYRVKIDVLFSVLTEIAKNSQDHTGSDAFWGIDIVENLRTKTGEFIFSCSDMGVGILQQVRMFLKETPQDGLRPEAWKHLSLIDAYKWAFTLGNTSGKTTNKGIGMTMIIDGAYNLSMDLSIWDANSMMFIPKSLFFFPESLNHEELRKRAYYTKNKVGFNYYGRFKF
jgi:hypothetical protein